MAKPIKVKRYNNIYKKGRKGPSKQFWKRIITIIVFVAIVGFSYVIASKILNDTPSPEIQTSSYESTPSQAEQSDSSKEESIATQTQADFKAVTLTSAQLFDDSRLSAFLTDAVSTGFDSVIIPYKAEDGLILYDTSVAEAASWSAVSSNTVDAQVIAQKVKNAGLTPIASLSAFIDNSAAHASRNNAITYQGNPSTTWLGGANGTIRWLNPYKDIARKYITDLVSELKNYGYDNIMLSNVKFPESANGKYDLFDDNVPKQTILTQFIDELHATGANIILAFEWNMITDGETEYGGDPSALGAAYNAPIIDLSVYSNGFEQDGRMITGNSEIVYAVINQIISNSRESAVAPILGEYNEEIINALKNAGINSYIIQ